MHTLYIYIRTLYAYIIYIHTYTCICIYVCKQTQHTTNAETENAIEQSCCAKKKYIYIFSHAYLQEYTNYICVTATDCNRLQHTATHKLYIYVMYKYIHTHPYVYIHANTAHHRCRSWTRHHGFLNYLFMYICFQIRVYVYLNCIYTLYTYVHTHTYICVCKHSARQMRDTPSSTLVLQSVAVCCSLLQRVLQSVAVLQ